MLIATVVGNRPQFVKAAAVSRKLRERTDELLIHTGQHYDDELSRIFFEELEVRRPDRSLDCRSRTPMGQVAAMAFRIAARASAWWSRSRIMRMIIRGNC